MITIQEQIKFMRAAVASLNGTDITALRPYPIEKAETFMLAVIKSLDREAEFQRLEALEKCEMCGEQLADANETRLCPNCG